MDKYVSFVACFTGTALYLAGAYIPRTYIEALHKSQQPPNVYTCVDLNPTI